MSHKAFQRRRTLGKFQQPAGTLAKAEATVDLFSEAFATAATLDSCLRDMQAELPEISRLALQTRMEEIVLKFLSAYKANRGIPS